MADVPLVKSPVPVSEISATGTASSTTFLRGDGSWSTPAAGATGAFRGARVYRSAALNLATATETAIAFDAETFDTNTLHDTATNNSRITLDTVGFWEVSGQVSFPSTTAGSIIQSAISRNGVTLARSRRYPRDPQITGVLVRSLVQATAVTDYVELFGFQDTGGALALQAGDTWTYLEAHFLGT